jgi:hypothetical protein
MTAVAALELWHEVELREALLEVAFSGTAGEPEEFIARAWSLLSRLKAGQSAEYYMSRVVVECCSPRWARGG